MTVKCCCICKKENWLFKYWNQLQLWLYNKLISFAHAIFSMLHCWMIGTLNDGFGKSAIPRDIYISGIHSTQFLQQHFALGPDRFLFFSPHDNDGYILWYVVVILVISSGISTVIFLQLYEKHFCGKYLCQMSLRIIKYQFLLKCYWWFE